MSWLPTFNRRQGGALLAACVAVVLLSSEVTANQQTTVVIDFRDGVISLDATEAAWSDVIVELTRKTGIRVHVASLPGEPLTTSFTQVDPPQALRRLFEGSSGFAFVYGSGPVPVEVWVAPTTVPAASEARVARLEIPVPTDLRDADPKTRAYAVDQLAGAHGDHAVEILARLVVTDPDVDVRSAAATTLVQIGTPRAFKAARAAVFDEAKRVRLRTVEALADHGGESARQILREALHDSTEEVRDAAAAGIPSADVANAAYPMIRGR